jgi:ferric-dicitrate binding protein FerR (iron transport regulator)
MSVSLADGSVIHLNTDTAVDVSLRGYAKAMR